MMIAKTNDSSHFDDRYSKLLRKFILGLGRTYCVRPLKKGDLICDMHRKLKVLAGFVRELYITPTIE